MSGCGRFSRLGVFFVVAVAALAACDSTTEPAEPLTLEEAEALYLGMLGVVADSAAEIVSSTPDGGVFACRLGGEVTVAFDFREETAADTTRVTTNFTLDPDGCVLSSEGYDFTVDGNPNVTMALTVSRVESTVVFPIEGSTTGGVDWKLDDRSGTCLIDLAYSLDLSGPEPAGSATGTMCGLEVEFDQSIEPPAT